MRLFNRNAVPLVNPKLPHQIKLSSTGNMLMVSCNCGMAPRVFHPEDGDDPREIYDDWHKGLR